MNADHMIDETTPRINAAERAGRHARMEQAKRDGALDWAEVDASGTPEDTLARARTALAC